MVFPYFFFYRVIACSKTTLKFMYGPLVYYVLALQKPLLKVYSERWHVQHSVVAGWLKFARKVARNITAINYNASVSSFFFFLKWQAVLKLASLVKALFLPFLVNWNSNFNVNDQFFNSL